MSIADLKSECELRDISSTGTKKHHIVPDSHFTDVEVDTGANIRVENFSDNTPTTVTSHGEGYLGEDIYCPEQFGEQLPTRLPTSSRFGSDSLKFAPSKSMNTNLDTKISLNSSTTTVLSGHCVGVIPTPAVELEFSSGFVLRDCVTGLPSSKVLLKALVSR
jgi:hypothetical protein